MAIKPQPKVNQGANVPNYVPGSQNFPAVGSCGVMPGDIIGLKDMTGPALAALVPDSDGFLPHFAYYPKYDFLTDPWSKTSGPGRIAGRVVPTILDEGSQFKNHPGAIYGNDVTPPVIRVDLNTPLFCRYQGDVLIEGGDLTGAPAFPDNQIQISFWWARQWALERDRLDRGGLFIPQLVTATAPVAHTLTFYNAARGAFVQRPRNADAVMSPDGVALLGSYTNGASATTAPLALSQSQFIPLGSFQFVAPSSDVGSLIFRVWL